jgi:hypothetical protein
MEWLHRTYNRSAAASHHGKGAKLQQGLGQGATSYNGIGSDCITMKNTLIWAAASDNVTVDLLAADVLANNKQRRIGQ